MAPSYDKTVASAVFMLVYLLAGEAAFVLLLLLFLFACFCFSRECLNKSELVQDSAEHSRAAGKAGTGRSQKKSERRSCQTRLATDEPGNENFNRPKCISGVSCLGEYQRWFSGFLCTPTLNRQRCTREKKETCGAVVVTLEQKQQGALSCAAICCNSGGLQ